MMYSCACTYDSGGTLWQCENCKDQASVVVAQSELTRLREDNEKLKEALSYLPKVPTEPYEKEMAKEIISLREKLAQVTALHKATNERLQMAIDTLKYYADYHVKQKKQCDHYSCDCLVPEKARDTLKKLESM